MSKTIHRRNKPIHSEQVLVIEESLRVRIKELYHEKKMLADIVTLTNVGILAIKVILGNEYVKKFSGRTGFVAFDNLDKKSPTYQRDYKRLHKGSTHDGSIKKSVNRRPRLTNCELCSKEEPNVSLSYHHFNDEDLDKGVWCCTKCHRFAESIDQTENIDDFVLRYTTLKKSIQSYWNP